MDIKIIPKISESLKIRTKGGEGSPEPAEIGFEGEMVKSIQNLEEYINKIKVPSEEAFLLKNITKEIEPVAEEQERFEDFIRNSINPTRELIAK